MSTRSTIVADPQRLRDLLGRNIRENDVLKRLLRVSELVAEKLDDGDMQPSILDDHLGIMGLLELEPDDIRQELRLLDSQSKALRVLLRARLKAHRDNER